MDFQELRKLDKYSAFFKFVSVYDAKQNGIIPSEYHDVVKDRCKCGSENIITEDLKTIMCCNPRCRIKMGYALAEMFSRFGAKDIAEKTSADIIDSLYDKLKIPSHVEILRLKPKDFPLVLDGERGITFVKAMDVIYGTKLTLGELISKIAIPSFDMDSLKIFKGIATVSDLLDEIIKSDGIVQFLQKRNVEDSMKRFYLDIFLTDIAYAEESLFNTMRQPGLSRVDVCITGSISPNGQSMTKSEFIELCNDTCTLPNGIRPIEVRMTSAIASVPYVIADYPSSTSKYLKGRERNVIITSTEFLNKLKEVMEDVREQQNSSQQ